MHGQETQRPNLRELSFSNDRINALWIREVQNYRIDGRAVVTNIHYTDAHVAGSVNDPDRGLAPRETTFPLRPWHSTIVADSVIARAESLILIQVVDERNSGSLVVDPRWRLFGTSLPEDSPFPRNTPLWISPHDELNGIDVDPCHLSTGTAGPKETTRMNLKANLWFATGQTDCFIHTGHEFMEIHTQIYGSGRMQTFRERDERTLQEDVLMPPGFTHAPFFVMSPEGRPWYPWHRYFADTDCLWMALELYHV